MKREIWTSNTVVMRNYYKKACRSLPLRQSLLLDQGRSFESDQATCQYNLVFMKLIIPFTVTISVGFLFYHVDCWLRELTEFELRFCRAVGGASRRIDAGRIRGGARHWSATTGAEESCSDAGPTGKSKTSSVDSECRRRCQWVPSSPSHWWAECAVSILSAANLVQLFWQVFDTGAYQHRSDAVMGFGGFSDLVSCFKLFAQGIF